MQVPEPVPESAPDRKPRKDATRNRAAALVAADRLFAHCESPESVTMADIAAAMRRRQGDALPRLR